MTFVEVLIFRIVVATGLVLELSLEEEASLMRVETCTSPAAMSLKQCVASV